MDKTKKLILILLFCLINILSAQNNISKNNVISPIIKSAILPGWGEYSLGNSTRGNLFLTTELFGIALSTFSFIKSNNQSSTYRAFAAEHANVDIDGKNHQYWVDIGNYNSQIDYNDDHMRQRDYNNLYPDEAIWIWSWDSDEKRKEFEDKRIASDRTKLIAKFFIGGIVLNHIISVIDVYYLKNISISDNVGFTPFYNPNNQELVYSIQFKL